MMVAMAVLFLPRYPFALFIWGVSLHIKAEY